jgi:hypothetical protein
MNTTRMYVRPEVIVMSGSVIELAVPLPVGDPLTLAAATVT